MNLLDPALFVFLYAKLSEGYPKNGIWGIECLLTCGSFCIIVYCCFRGAVAKTVAADCIWSFRESLVQISETRSKQVVTCHLNIVILENPPRRSYYFGWVKLLQKWEDVLKCRHNAFGFDGVCN